jgi:hypothetical protein
MRPPVAVHWLKVFGQQNTPLNNAGLNLPSPSTNVDQNQTAFRLNTPLRSFHSSSDNAFDRIFDRFVSRKLPLIPAKR